jgi:glycosyltransferase involved in cell wall biosynthesis
MIDYIVATIGRDTLNRTLSSISKQRFVNNIIIIKPKRINIHESKFAKNLIIFDEDSKGNLYSALNLGILQSNSAFLSFVHDDDWLDPDFSEHGIKSLKLHSDKSWVTGKVNLESNHNITEYLLPSLLRYPEIASTFPQIFHPASIYRREVFLKVGLFKRNVYFTKLKIAADFDWQLRAYRLDLLPIIENNMIYHMQDDGISKKYPQRALVESMLVSFFQFKELHLLSKWLKYPYLNKTKTAYLIRFFISLYKEGSFINPVIYILAVLTLTVKEIELRFRPK